MKEKLLDYKIIEFYNLHAVAFQRRASYIEAKERGAMARVKARWDTAEGKATPNLVIV